ncbi:MAG: hypothetical protein KAR20_07310, partial [Candidatus Heimdallarchaeota archaeon]|nr:hypothetical protein [Candidatus Heimdallarchaeota archaeon]
KEKEENQNHQPRHQLMDFKFMVQFFVSLCKFVQRLISCQGLRKSDVVLRIFIQLITTIKRL